MPIAFDLPADLSPQLAFLLDLGVAAAAALLGGALVARLGQPPIVGYLLAGVAIGPFTPGFVGDVERIAELADVGVVLLLFALGVQFSLRELASVRRVAVAGGLAQVLVVLAIGALVMLPFGLEPAAALVLGACLSISSTVVVLKLLIARGELDSLSGRAAIGWMIVQDLATIVFIVMLPSLAGGDPLVPLLLALVKAAIFLVIAYVVGTRLLPPVFAWVARLRSQELFLLTVVGTAMLTAFVSSAVFGLSIALGAFVAGLLVSGSALSYQAAAEVIPFRDLFAVFFFVSVGMLVDPAALAEQAPLVALLIALAIGAKGVLTAGLGRILGLPLRSAIVLGGLVTQVGEFSFLLAQDALGLGIFDAATYNVVLGTAVGSIVLSPSAVRLADRAALGWERRLDRRAGRVALPATTADGGPSPAKTSDQPAGGNETGARTRGERTGLTGPDGGRRSIVVLGVGRVGRVVVQAARARGFRTVAVDRDPRRLEEAARHGADTIYGDAANPYILARAGLDRAQVLVVAVGDPLAARLAIERSLAINPRLQIAARARGRREIDRLRGFGVRRLADPEAEAAVELARHALQRMGVAGPELSGLLVGLRRDVYGP